MAHWLRHDMKSGGHGFKLGKHSTSTSYLNQKHFKSNSKTVTDDIG